MPAQYGGGGGAYRPAPQQNPQPQQQRRPDPQRYGPSSNGRDDDDGVEFNEGDDQGGAGDGGGRWGKSNEFGNLFAGDHEFVVHVNSIIRWESGVVVTFRVIWGNDRGREIRWQQSPIKGSSDKAHEVWRKQFFTAYAAGGWTVAPDPQRKWNGWENSSRQGSNGKPLPLPPYDRFFVAPPLTPGAPSVPLALVIDVRVDEGYEQYPKVLGVRPLLDERGVPAQAPIPRKVIDWIAQRNGWRGMPDDRLMASGKATKPVVLLDNKQVAKAAGMTWYSEVLKARAQPSPQRRHADDTPF